jgi:hypothetical protein
VVARITDAAELGLAGRARSEVPDEGREVGEMGLRDLGGRRQMLQAVRRKSPRHVTLEDLTDTSLLGTGEHDTAIVVDPPDVGQWPRRSQGRSGAPITGLPEILPARIEAVEGHEERRGGGIVLRRPSRGDRISARPAGS